MKFFTRQERVMLLAVMFAVGAVCVSNVAAQGTAGSGTFTDKRDGKTYKTVKIGGKTWMAENLNYKPETGKFSCYDKIADNCIKYGRLYDYKMAKTICPTGWHLAKFKELIDLQKSIGGKWNCQNDPETGEYCMWEGNVGKKLKAKDGWNDNGNGTDIIGFSALPGGTRCNCEPSFMNIGTCGSWWFDDGPSMGGLIKQELCSYGENMSGYELATDNDGASVRCVQD
jgi:uncharacterized protein (TIGR02145 family)